MPAELFYFLALLVVAVAFGYFYLKRAQARTQAGSTDQADPARPTGTDTR